MGDLSPIGLVQISESNKKKIETWGGQAEEVQQNFNIEDICEGVPLV
jgi:hypothetical protein